MMCFPFVSRIRVETTTRDSLTGRVIRTVSNYDATGRRIRQSRSSFGSYEKPHRRSKSSRHHRRDSYSSDEEFYPSKRPYQVAYSPAGPPPGMHSEIPPPPPPIQGMGMGRGMPNRLLLDAPPPAPPMMPGSYGSGMRMGGMNNYDVVDVSPMGDSYPPAPIPPPYGIPQSPFPPMENGPYGDEPYGDEREGRHHSGYPREGDYLRGSSGGRIGLPRGVKMGGGWPTGVRYGQGDLYGYDDDEVEEMNYAGAGRYR